MSAETDVYIAKRREFEQATSARRAIIDLVITAGRSLEQSPNTFHFSNIPGGFPPEVIMSRNAPSIDGNQWPTAIKIQEALVNWHKAKHELNNAWHSVPQADRGALQPPPGHSR